MNAATVGTTVNWKDGNRRYSATFGKIVEVNGVQYQEFACRFRQASKSGTATAGFINLAESSLVDLDLRNGRIYGTFEPTLLNKAHGLL